MPGDATLIWSRGPIRADFAVDFSAVRLPSSPGAESRGMAKAIRAAAMHLTMSSKPTTGDVWVVGDPVWLAGDFPTVMPVCHHVYPSVESWWNFFDSFARGTSRAIFCVGEPPSLDQTDMVAVAQALDVASGTAASSFLAGLHRPARVKGWVTPWTRDVPPFFLERRAGELFAAPVFSSAWEGRKRFGLLGRILGLHSADTTVVPGRSVRSSVGFCGVTRGAHGSPAGSYACARADLSLKPRDLEIGKSTAAWVDRWLRETTGAGLSDQSQVVVSCASVGPSLSLDTALRAYRSQEDPAWIQHWDLIWGWNPTLSSAMFTARGEPRRALIVLDQFARPFAAACWPNG